MKLLTHPAAVAFGLANLYLLSASIPLISPDHDLVFLLSGSASVIFIPVMVYLVALWALLFLALVVSKRLSESVGRMVWAALFLVVPWRLLRTFSAILEFDIPHWARFLVWFTALVLFLLIVLPRGPLRRAFDAALPFFSTVLGMVAVCGVVIFAQLLTFAWQSRNLNPAPALHRAQADPPSRPRIIWIVLDELSYQQVYERRFPGLDLPAFDRLAAQSTVFTHVVPAGRFTKQVMPSLLTGIPDDGIEVSGAGLLTALHDTSSKTWRRFDQHQTVFQDALDKGYSTGIAGWYNPSCRIMPQVLDHCYWTFGEAMPGRFSPYGSVASNLRIPLHDVALDLRHLLREGSGPLTNEQLDLQMRSADYRDLLEAADTFLSDRSIGFLLIHMPVPHPLGFYDRKNHRLARRHTSYIDNLALADQYLGHVEQLLQQQGQWDSSTIVVMGDHSWRTSFIWSVSAGWSPEDRAASHGGQFDDRPGYIVKLPDQHTGERVDESFSAVRTRALFDAMLAGRIETPDQLIQWARPDSKQLSSN